MVLQIKNQDQIQFKIKVYQKYQIILNQRVR
jgi:hypothetical protein